MISLPCTSSFWKIFIIIKWKDFLKYAWINFKVKSVREDQYVGQENVAVPWECSRKKTFFLLSAFILLLLRSNFSSVFQNSLQSYPTVWEDNATITTTILLPLFSSSLHNFPRNWNLKSEKMFTSRQRKNHESLPWCYDTDLKSKVTVKGKT